MFRKVINSRAIFALVTVIGFALNGCDSGTGVNSLNSGLISKERLTKQPYYTINKCYDEIVKYQFFDDTYKKTFYQDQSFTTVDNEIIDRVEYLNQFDVIIYQDDIKLECSVADDNKDGNIELYCVNSLYKDDPEQYYILRTLYKTKELAVRHQDEDCP